MIITDNKKAQTFDGQGLIDVITKEVNNMSSLALSFNEVNFTPVQQDNQFCQTVNFLGGTRMGVNPKWFNVQAW